MRILFISNSTSVSGAPAALLNLVSELHARHEIAVVVPDASGPLYDALVSYGIRCYYGLPYRLTIWPRVFNPVKLIRRFHELAFLLKKQRKYVADVIDDFRPDVVHTNVGPLDLALDHCIKKNIPHVWHLREFQNGMTFWPSEKSFRKKILSDGNWNVAITSCVHEYWGLRGCDPVIYDGVKSSSEVMATSSVSRDFLFVGRVERNKGLLELLRAFRLYRSGGGEAGLNVVGRVSSFYGVLCRIYVNLNGLRSSVTFHGHRNDVLQMMREAAAVVVPSRTEGFGLVSVEAMSEGCLVVGNDTTGMKEQFDIGRDFTGGEIGIRYKGYRELSEVLSDISAGRVGNSEMKARAKATVRTCYSLEDRVRDLEDFYVKLIEETR